MRNTFKQSYLLLKRLLLSWWNSFWSFKSFSAINTDILNSLYTSNIIFSELITCFLVLGYALKKFFTTRGLVLIEALKVLRFYLIRYYTIAKRTCWFVSWYIIGRMTCLSLIIPILVCNVLITTFKKLKNSPFVVIFTVD